MAKLSRPRWGSLQFWPRKRAAKLLPSANWKTFSSLSFASDGLLGYIGYKAGMASAVVKDDTPNSMTKGKKITVPVTIVEMPPMKVYSVRFYKLGIVQKEIVVSNDPALKPILRVPKQPQTLDKLPEGYDDIRVVVFSVPSKTSVKKTPDVLELAVTAKDKLAYIKSLIAKELSYKDLPQKLDLIDARGVTKGRGLIGPLARFGLTLKQHKSEKGRRRPGSLAPWHPARVTFRTPMAGQMGLFSRIQYNLKLLATNSIADKNINPGTGFQHYGNIQSNYMIVLGSLAGPVKRAVLLTPAFRPSKNMTRKKYELVEVLK